MKFKDQMLLDSFESTGTDIDEFTETVSEMVAHTKRAVRSMQGIHVLSLRRNTGVGTDRMRFYKMAPSEPLKYYPEEDGYKFVPFAVGYERNFGKNKDFRLFVNEMADNMRMAIWDEECSLLYFVSDNMINTFAQRIGVSVQKYKDPSVERDLYTAKSMDVYENATLIIREYKDIRKVFAMMSGSYPDIELSEILDVIGLLKEEYPDIESREWSISNYAVRIRLALPEYAEELAAQYPTKLKPLPCIELTTSDVGKSAFKARACWELENGHVFYDKAMYTREHRGEMDVNEMADAIIALYPQFEEFPKRMSELEEMDVKVDTNVAFHSVYQHLFKKTKLDKIIGKHREPTMKMVLRQEIGNNRCLTASDLMWKLINVTEPFRSSLPSDWKLDGETYRKYKDALSEIPYICFKEARK